MTASNMLRFKTILATNLHETYILSSDNNLIEGIFFIEHNVTLSLLCAISVQIFCVNPL